MFHNKILIRLIKLLYLINYHKQKLNQFIKGKLLELVIVIRNFMVRIKSFIEKKK